MQYQISLDDASSESTLGRLSFREVDLRQKLVLLVEGLVRLLREVLHYLLLDDPGDREYSARVRRFISQQVDSTDFR